MQMISGKDLARLHMDLSVPHVLAGVLNRPHSLSAADDDLLRAAFDGCTPLEVIVSLACGLQILVPHLVSEPDLLEPLLAHADDMLDDYAPLLMSRTVPTPEWRDFICGDLELTGDFLSIISDASLGIHPAVSDICDILHEQAFLKTMPAMTVCSGNVIRFPVERRA